MLPINISLWVTQKMKATAAIVWLRKILNISIGLSCLVPSQHAAVTGTARKNLETFKVHDWTVDSCLDLQEFTEQTAVNCTVDVTGEKL